MFKKKNACIWSTQAPITAGIEGAQLRRLELLLFTFPTIANIRGVRRVLQWGPTLYVSTYTRENTGFVKSDWPQLPSRLAWAKGFEVAFSSGACFATADSVKTDDLTNKMTTLQLHQVKWIWFLNAIGCVIPACVIHILVCPVFLLGLWPETFGMYYTHHGWHCVTPANREYSQNILVRIKVMNKRSSSNVNRMFVQRYLVFDNVLKMLAQKYYL